MAQVVIREPESRLSVIYNPELSPLSGRKQSYLDCLAQILDAHTEGNLTDEQKERIIAELPKAQRRYVQEINESLKNQRGGCDIF